MTVRLRPELESMIRSDIQCGRYQSVEEFVERAVELLHEQEQWLASHREEIDSMIEIGINQAERGELIDADAATQLLSERHSVYLTKR